MKQRPTQGIRSRLSRPVRSRRLAAAVALAGTVGLAACNSTPFQVIEELEFDPSLGIDLSQMERLPSGVYIEDVVVGTGLRVNPDSDVRVTYEGFLANGTKFGEGPLRFALGTRSVIAGFELGLIGALEFGTRKMVIPPALGYGDADQGTIPAGSVLVFVVTVDEVYDDSTE